jgi:hypothetical protein
MPKTPNQSNQMLVDPPFRLAYSSFPHRPASNTGRLAKEEL